MSLSVPTTPAYSGMFDDLLEEIDVETLPVEGTIPPWMSGCLLRNGPAQQHFGTETFRHWFDGFAMLHRFSFHNGRVSYRNRFLQSDAYTSAMTTGRNLFRDFASPTTDAMEGITDNAPVYLTINGKRHFALSETPSWIEFDPLTLRTLGALEFSDSIPEGFTTAHPQRDPWSGDAVNITISLSDPLAYNIYTLSPGSTTRQLVASIPTDAPTYAHSFAMTEHYYLIMELPFRLNVDELISGNTYIDSFHWHDQLAGRIVAVDKNSGDVAHTWETDPYFVFHPINAFDTAEGITLDVSAYNSPEIFQAFFHDHHDFGRLADFPTARRYALTFASESAIYETLTDYGAVEFPRLSYMTNNARPYRYFYCNAGSDAVLTEIVKVDVANGTTKNWTEEGMYPGEPVFASAPAHRNEDDGVVLSIVFDTGTSRSFLLVLDAPTMQEIGRALLPHHIPYSFHGNYYHTL